jgi:hypothetical protein
MEIYLFSHFTAIGLRVYETAARLGLKDRDAAEAAMCWGRMRLAIYEDAYDRAKEEIRESGLEGVSEEAHTSKLLRD